MQVMVRDCGAHRLARDLSFGMREREHGFATFAAPVAGSAARHRVLVGANRHCKRRGGCVFRLCFFSHSCPSSAFDVMSEKFVEIKAWTNPVKVLPRVG
eukprot:811500-Prymnesium_polylepis.1